MGRTAARVAAVALVLLAGTGFGTRLGAAQSATGSAAQPAAASSAASAVTLHPAVTLQEDTTLEAGISRLTAGFAGHLALYAVDLNSGRFVQMDADTPVQTASVIKLAILYNALEQIRAGTATWDDRLVLTKANQTPGSGVLQFFDTPLVLTLHDVLTMMIAESDNTATNMAIDHLGLEKIDAQIGQLGMRNTWLYKKIGVPATAPMPADQPRFGLGKTTPREMAGLMQRFVTCDLGSAPAIAAAPPGAQLCAASLSMLEKQSFRDSIPRYLDPSGVRIANKTGALDHVRNDVGVVYEPSGPVILSLFTYGNQDTSWTVDNGPEVLLARVARAVVEAWK